jgi:ribose transport system permease protein
MKAEVARARSVRSVGWRSGVQRYAILIILLLQIVILSFATPAFLSVQNFANILDQVSPVGILACAATIGIICGVFDLSMSAVMAVSGICAVLIAERFGTPVGWMSGILVGIGLGAISGTISHRGNLNSFIVTLATSMVFRGLGIVLTGGIISVTAAEGFRTLGQRFGPLTGATWLFLAVVVVTGFILARTGYGRMIYAVGGNLEAARLAGIRIGLVRMSVFMLSGGLAALAGLVFASRTATANPSMATGLELTAIAATVLGGTSILGGEGAIWRGMIGALILILIGNGMNLLAIESTFQLAVQGLLILVAISIDQLLREKN